MRDIKCRAWYEKSQTWVYIHIGQAFTDEAKKIYDEMCVNGIRWYEYTGLTDKNGTEIYEGDVIKFVEWIDRGDGAYDDDIQSVYFMNGSYYCDDEHLCYIHKDAEVIGNIYENEDLLK